MVLHYTTLHIHASTYLPFMCFVAPPFSFFLQFFLAIELLYIFQNVWCYTIPRFTYTLPHIFLLCGFWLYYQSLLHYIPNALYVIHIWQIPWLCQDRPLFIFYEVYSILLELLHGKRSCLKFISSVETQHIYMSLFFAVITIDNIVVFGANRMNHAMWIQTTVN